MTRPLVTGLAFGLGIWLVAAGLFPPAATLKARLTRFSEPQAAPDSGLAGRIDSFIGRPALWVLRAVRGELLSEVDADVAITGGDLEAYAVDKLKAGLGGMALLPVLSYALGRASSLLALTILGLAGLVIGYLIPDVELKRKAAVRRQEFGEALTGFVGLIAVSISGGGGVNSAMLETTSIGEGWSFDAIRQTLDDAFLAGESPWVALERLGRRLNVLPLIELASSLSLAGSSGARVTETLRARAESGRDKELSELLASAERKSESMNVPIAVMLLGWFGFLGYPAVANLLGS